MFDTILPQTTGHMRTSHARCRSRWWCVGQRQPAVLPQPARQLLRAYRWTPAWGHVQLQASSHASMAPGLPVQSVMCVMCVMCVLGSSLVVKSTTYTCNHGFQEVVTHLLRGRKRS